MITIGHSRWDSYIRTVDWTAKLGLSRWDNYYTLDRTIIIGHCVDRTFMLDTGHLDTVDETVTFGNSRQTS